MKFYHATTENNWIEIQKDGVLWGRKNFYWCGHLCDRINWLAINKEDALNFGSVLLEIDLPNIKEHIYWEYVTYEPISLDKIKRIKI